MKPPIIPTPAYEKAFVENMAIGQKKNRISPKLNTTDNEYIRSMFYELVACHKDVGIPDVKPKGQEGRRYTPLQMFNNCVRYMEATIKASQPLTITGVGLFMGLRREGLFEILSKKIQTLHQYPEYAFIFDFADFVEMYNEFAAHKKQNPAGPIFILKNFGWKDKFEVEASSTMGALTDAERQEAQLRISKFSESI